MLQPVDVAYISSILGKGIKVKIPSTLECALVTGGYKLFNAWQSMHSLLCGCCAHFGTTTMGLAQGETVQTIIPAFSIVSNSFYTKAVCFRDKL